MLAFQDITRAGCSLLLLYYFFVTGILASAPRRPLSAVTRRPVMTECPAPFENLLDYYEVDVNDRNPHSMLRLLDELEFELLWRTAPSETSRIAMIQNTVGCMMAMNRTKFYETIQGRRVELQNSFQVAKSFIPLYRQQSQEILPFFSVREQSLDTLARNDFIVSPWQLIVQNLHLSREDKARIGKVKKTSSETIENSMALQLYVNAGNDYFKRRNAAETFIDEVASMGGRFVAISEKGKLNPLVEDDEILCTALLVLQAASEEIESKHNDVLQMYKKWSSQKKK